MIFFKRDELSMRGFRMETVDVVIKTYILIIAVLSAGLFDLIYLRDVFLFDSIHLADEIVFSLGYRFMVVCVTVAHC